eukprot:TRINITY_DN2435_c0_g3_i1.p1 TRINITY_DN2435_c0_g3~~TRINITY_DN2435_c0_g3_i1.p1  ORF type:complete len:282 (-),score=55.46 TRINITY_DN2435_c0_g3_i1:88-807(-)
MGAFIQQSQAVCDVCGGQGKTIKPSDRCGTCKGQKVVKKNKRLEVKIEKGMKDGDHVVFEHEAHEEPGATTGNVIIQIRQKKHPQFVRRGNDLLMEKNLNLVDALGGFSFKVTHLDGRELCVESNPKGKIIKPGDQKVIPGEGMPKSGRSSAKGDLYVKFNVQFPDMHILSSTEMKKLDKLGTRKTEVSAEERKTAESVVLVDVAARHHKEESEFQEQPKPRREKRTAEQEHTTQCAQM